MKSEPKGLKETIQTHLQSAYGIEPIEMIFVPVGEESISYKVEAGEDTYIVKYYKDTSSLEHTKQTHALLEELEHNSFIIAPIKTIAQTSVHEIENGYISVFPFVKGPLVVEENTDFHEELVEKLVEICTLLQNDTSRIQTELPQENFNSPYSQVFAEVLKQAELHPEKQFSHIALKYEKKIHTLIDGVEKLDTLYKEQKPSLVLTHGDITGLNIIQIPGDIKLVDWDGAMLAPKERDLMFLTDSPFFNREEYLKEVNETSIDVQLITYYKLRWALDSIVLNLQILATQDIAEADEKVKLMEVEEYLGYY